jgi:hypothetical protein
MVSLKFDQASVEGSPESIHGGVEAAHVLD